MVSLSSVFFYRMGRKFKFYHKKNMFGVKEDEAVSLSISLPIALYTTGIVESLSSLGPNKLDYYPQVYKGRSAIYLH